MNPTVTVAIPTSNRLAYLRETLHDALQQDYENLEILVSDNGSTDGTRSVVEELATRNSRLRYRRNASRVPAIAHFNQCLGEASGDFFVLLSDDDRINPTFVSALAHALLQNRRATVAVPANSIINERGSLTRTLPPPSKATYEGIDFVIEWLWKIHELPVANLVTVMGRTAAMRKFRYQDFPSGLNSDDLLFLQLALGGQVTFCRDAIFYWRAHDSQQARTSPARLVYDAGCQFRAFARKNRALRGLILSHHPSKQKRVFRGIAQMTAETYLHRIDFFEKPLEWETVKHLLPCLTNFPLLRLVLRCYYRNLRRRVLGRSMSPAGI